MAETVYQEPRDLPRPSSTPAKPPRRQFKTALSIAVFVGSALAISILVFNANRPKPPAIMGASERSLAVSPDGKLLAVGELDGSLRLVSTGSSRTLAKTQLASAIMALTFGPDGSLLVLAQNDPRLYIFSGDLRSHAEREVHPNPHDLVWSPGLDAAVVVSGGPDEIHPKLEFFPAKPLGLANSTSELYDLKAWAAPRNLSVPADGSRVAVTLGTSHRANLIFYNPKERRVVAESLIAGTPKGTSFAQDGSRVWVVSPDAEAVTELASNTSVRIDFPKSASTSPLLMIAVNESARRAYTTGSLTFAEVDLDQHKISRTVELPARSSGIALSPDGRTAYLTFDNLNQIDVVDVQNMRWLHAIELR